MTSIPMMKQFSIEELLNVLDSCHMELRTYFHEYQEKKAFEIAQDAKDAHDFLMAEYITKHCPEQIH